MCLTNPDSSSISPVTHIPQTVKLTFWYDHLSISLRFSVGESTQYQRNNNYNAYLRHVHIPGIEPRSSAFLAERVTY